MCIRDRLSIMTNALKKINKERLDHIFDLAQEFINYNTSTKY